VPSSLIYAATRQNLGSAPLLNSDIIFKKSSKKQTVTFDELLEIALTRGWVDVQTKGVDDERYGIRFVPRKLGSNWSATNRRIVKRLLNEGRMHPAGKALVPDDLYADE
jgi:uncharacterized protein YdeI (YjbR/CyaY-like superfamily)